MQFFGVVFILSTTLILLFKKETNSNYEYDELTESDMSIQLTFKSLWQILKLAPIQKFLIILFTCKVSKISRIFKLKAA